MDSVQIRICQNDIDPNGFGSTTLDFCMILVFIEIKRFYRAKIQKMLKKFLTSLYESGSGYKLEGRTVSIFIFF
jgi:hypothetical protein